VHECLNDFLNDHFKDKPSLINPEDKPFLINPEDNALLDKPGGQCMTNPGDFIGGFKIN